MKNLLVAAVLLIMIACNQQQRNENSGEPLSSEDSLQQKREADSAKLSIEDQNFVKAIALSGMVEIAIGKLAKEMSKDTAIQNFGSLLATHHQQLAKDLKDVVAQRDIHFPEKLDDIHQQKIDSLKAVSSSDFDRTFLQMMINDHNTALALFDQTGAHGKDVQLQAFANKNIPIIRNHLRIANGLINKRGQ